MAEHIEYRLALEAPGPWAGPEVVQGSGRFTLGPLPEVAASTHSWSELDPHLPAGPARSVTAHERVLRGEDLSAVDAIDAQVVELPLCLQDWEPRYALADYGADKADFPMPEIPRFGDATDLFLPAPSLDQPETHDALIGLVRAWTDESNGRADAIAVHGDAIGAIYGLGLRRALVAEIPSRLAMALMGWGGASGGAYGRRPGAAAGRLAAWWTAAALADLLDEWPVPPDRLGRAVGDLRWFAWSDLAPPTGWTLHLAAEDPRRRLGWALAAVDAR